jgi:N-acetylglucosaminyl-diphospho-decaprenol L-rhamnosyltransferase
VLRRDDVAIERGQIPVQMKQRNFFVGRDLVSILRDDDSDRRAPGQRLHIVDSRQAGVLAWNNCCVESRVAAVVVAHASLDHARRCVASLRPWLPPESIVVVLNIPSAVDTAELETLRKDARVISPATPQGYGANLNFGVRELRGDPEFYLLANDDVYFEPESLNQLVRCLEDEPRAGVAGARLVGPDGGETVSFSRFPTVRDLVVAATVLPGPLWRRRERWQQPWEAEPGDEGFPVGAVLLVRFGALVDVGGFDEDFFLNWEEADFCRRVLDNGWTVLSCREATVTHAQGASIDRDVNLATFYASEGLYFRKRLGRLRWTALEFSLLGLFVFGTAYDAILAAAKPRTARRRLDSVVQRWKTRVFLRS